MCVILILNIHIIIYQPSLCLTSSALDGQLYRATCDLDDPNQEWFFEV